jgi:hypothetical protein
MDMKPKLHLVGIKITLPLSSDCWYVPTSRVYHNNKVLKKFDSPAYLDNDSPDATLDEFRPMIVLSTLRLPHPVKHVPAPTYALVVQLLHAFRLDHAVSLFIFSRTQYFLA